MWYYFVIVNLIAYILMWWDKIRAIKKGWGISEKTLWTIAIIGGVGGIFLGMQAPIFHKAGKSKFKILIPIILLAWIVIIGLLLYL